MEAVVVWLASAPAWQVVPALLIENLVVFLGALAFGALLVRHFAAHRVTPPPPPLTRQEVTLAAANVVMNTIITIAGWRLWKIGVIGFRTDTGFRAALDVPILILVMDLAMYALHRLAHTPWLFPVLHRLHHEYDRPRPLTLFVMHPLENLAFGSLWLAVIAAHPFSWLGISAYLGLNVVSGVIGHLGVEPLPRGVLAVPALREVAGGTFHAQHHQDVEHNFGFYTLVWDRLFGTLAPTYDDAFAHLPAAVPPRA